MARPILIDTHAHLCDARFEHDLDEVLGRAREAGVEAIVVVGESVEDAHRNLALAASRPGIFPAAGLYPTRLSRTEADEMERLVRTHRDRLVGIGEVGLDRFEVREDEALALQMDIFLRFASLARELDLPLNVHSRSAGSRAVEALLDVGATRVHLHAFDGRPAAAMPAVEAGWKFSIPPSVVRSRQKQKLVARLPLDCLMLESDSPVLGPEPRERNEPANVAVACAAVAEILGLSVDEVAERTTQNARSFYRLDD